MQFVLRRSLNPDGSVRVELWQGCDLSDPNNPIPGHCVGVFPDGPSAIAGAQQLKAALQAVPVEETINV